MSAFPTAYEIVSNDPPHHSFKIGEWVLLKKILGPEYHGYFMYTNGRRDQLVHWDCVRTVRYNLT